MALWTARAGSASLLSLSIDRSDVVSTYHALADPPRRNRVECRASDSRPTRHSSVNEWCLAGRAPGAAPKPGSGRALDWRRLCQRPGARLAHRPAVGAGAGRAVAVG